MLTSWAPRSGATCADHYSRWQEGCPQTVCIHQGVTMWKVRRSGYTAFPPEQAGFIYLSYIELHLSAQTPPLFSPQNFLYFH